MADVTVKRIEDFEAAFGGGFVRVRAGLGVTSFGIQVLRFPPHADQYPEHDHERDGQEEVYMTVSGRATLRIGGEGGEEHELTPGTFARVGSTETRKITTGEEGAEILALGGVPGAAFEVTPGTDEGAPDPTTGPEE